jgi:hypothetical protein
MANDHPMASLDHLAKYLEDLFLASGGTYGSLGVFCWKMIFGTEESMNF